MFKKIGIRVEYLYKRDNRFLPVHKIKEGYIYNLVELRDDQVNGFSKPKVKYSEYVKVKDIDIKKLVILYHKVNSPGNGFIEDLTYYGVYWGLQSIL